MSVWKRLLLLGVCVVFSALNGRAKTLEPAPSPVDNPLKGLVPYQGDRRDKFPHSMEFNYIALSSLVTNYDTYNWKPLDELLNDVSSRGHQTVFRVYLEYSGKLDEIPAFLVKDGLRVTTWQDAETSPIALNTPDYSNLLLLRVLKSFILALGKRYDGDARIAYITAGLLGRWGEWHDWPRDDLFASPAVQNEVMNAYEKAFKITPILLRYPSKGDASRAANDARPFGYHDDSFAWSTFDAQHPEKTWYFMALMREAGKNALDKWKTRPIGGEIRPEAWGEVFDATPRNPQIQDFRQCVDATHVTWLMDSGLFDSENVPEDVQRQRVRRATDEVRRMGYDFTVRNATLGAIRNNRLTLQLEILNRGVAPFYYNWPVELGLLDANKRLVHVQRSKNRITGILPDTKTIWKENLDVSKLGKGVYQLVLRIPNSLRNGQPVRFANKTQDADLDGWLTLDEFSRR